MIVEKLSDNRKLLKVINRIHEGPWPQYIKEDPVIKHYWPKLYKNFAGYQLLYRNGKSYIGLANTIPIYWDGDNANLPHGVDDVLIKAFDTKHKANTLVGLTMLTSKDSDYEKTNASILHHLKDFTRQTGLKHLILPVRPTLKYQYPITPLENYLTWKKGDAPFDAKLAVHLNNGGEILKVIESSISVTADIREWEFWTGMHFGGSGAYIIPRGLNPLTVDLDKNVGTYREPCIWMQHRYE